MYTTLHHLQQLAGAARGINFLPRQPARSVLNGRYASKLRGRGLNFEELRGYLPGDDIRSIDWKATARKREPHVRVYTEERDRPALVIVDQRLSMFFGSTHAMKSVTAAEVAAATAARVLAAGDRIGGLVFDDREMVEIRPQRSRRALHALLQAIDSKNNALRADDPVPHEPMILNTPLEAAARIARHDHLVVVISDFSGVDDSTHRFVSSLARGNDTILMLVHDPWAREMPRDVSMVASNGILQITVDTSSTRRWRRLQEVASGRLQRILDWQTSLGVSVVPISCGEDAITQLRRLMGRFSRRGHAR